ncbi:MAG: hypothetical protein IJ466_07465 [Clostridia bacterium]|nr:hypothetical protein [Clostridia bacterium]
MKKWIKLIAALLVVALLAWLGWTMVHGIIAALSGAELGASEEPDPMFADAPEEIERPAELDMEEAQPDHPTLDDYVPEVESPVDMTVEELIREAQNGKS